MKDTISLQTKAMLFGNVISTCIFTDIGGNVLSFNQGMTMMTSLLRKIERQQSCLYFIGNGGSAAVASHMSNDFCNIAGIRTGTLHDTALLTCFINDYGYDNAHSMLISRLSVTNDVLVAISSSGESKNIHKAATSMKNNGREVITLSGFSKNNQLRKQGDINIWLDTEDYALAEIGHLFILHYISDRYSIDKA